MNSEFSIAFDIILFMIQKIQKFYYFSLCYISMDFCNKDIRTPKNISTKSYDCLTYDNLRKITSTIEYRNRDNKYEIQIKVLKNLSIITKKSN